MPARNWPFQPTLLAFTRSDSALRRAAPGLRVSTHAPRVHEERRGGSAGGPSKIEFQPTLLAFTRSDRPGFAEVARYRFQPTLLAFTRSDWRPNTRESPAHVSTHAPRVHEERPAPRWLPRSHRVSTHAPRVHEERPAAWSAPRFSDQLKRERVLAFTRSDMPLRPPSAVCKCFNPRSSRSRGATRLDFDRHVGHLVSTHAPRVHEERLVKVRFVHEPGNVSTHAPRVHEERRRPVAVSPERGGRFNPRSSRSRGATAAEYRDNAAISKFQPTLLAFTRSDLESCTARFGEWFQPTLLAFTRSDLRAATPDGETCVSTHAPRVHEERHHQADRVPRTNHVVSTHAPRVHEERRFGGALGRQCTRVSTHAPRVHEERHRARAGRTTHMRFQPTLLAFTRSDQRRAEQLPHLVLVSTHAPRVHEERPATALRFPMGSHVFQPTLLAFTRSDDWLWTDLDGESCFNPRSSRSRGATVEVRSKRARGVFQPTLLAFTRSDVSARPTTPN